MTREGLFVGKIRSVDNLESMNMTKTLGWTIMSILCWSRTHAYCVASIVKIWYCMISEMLRLHCQASLSRRHSWNPWTRLFLWLSPQRPLCSLCAQPGKLAGVPTDLRYQLLLWKPHACKIWKKNDIYYITFPSFIYPWCQREPSTQNYKIQIYISSFVGQLVPLFQTSARWFKERVILITSDCMLLAWARWIS